MDDALRRHGPEYLMEAAGLGASAAEGSVREAQPSHERRCIFRCGYGEMERAR
ncbi:MAG: hypothetical protein WBG20_06905 [Candidatus Deferrimicrobiaceae bacterium]